MPFHLFVNPSSGPDDDAGELIARSEHALDDVRTTVIEPDTDLEAAVREAVADGRVVVAAGGDGTIGAVAHHLVGGEGTLGVLPAGTRNHFAKDLGIEALDGAMETLRDGRAATIDVGRLDGRTFLNNVGLGLYPELVRERERSEDRWGKLLATVTAAARVVRGARPLTGTIAADGDERELRAWALFVGNGRYSIAPASIGERERLDEGVLDVHLLRARLRPSERVRVAAKMARGELWASRAVVRRDARTVEVRLSGSPRPPSRDGEADPPERRITIEIVPRSLRVLTPRT